MGGKKKTKMDFDSDKLEISTPQCPTIFTVF